MLEIESISIFSDIDISTEEIRHYGIKRRSGRYPWGSGDSPYQHSGDFMNRVNELKKSGMSEKDIAKALDINTTSDLRAYYRVAMHEQKMRTIASIKSMKGDGYSNAEIAEKLGLKGESTVRSMLKEDAETRLATGMKTAEMLKQLVAEKGNIDVSSGAELELGISKIKLEEALTILDAEGYKIYGRGVSNATSPGKQTNTVVLCPPGTEYKDVYKQPINTVQDYISYDNGESFRKSFIYPSSLDVKRLQVVYAEDGGTDRDGLIEVRRGVPDLSLGGVNYAQVRIMVNGTHYLKGMCTYADDLPDGVDVRFNTNKSKSKPVIDIESPDRDKCVLKPIKNDPDNPFGSLIKEHGGQSFYDDPNGEYVDPLTGNRQSLSLINKRAEEGDWDRWSRKLPSQFLSKQNEQLIDRQLGLAIADKKEDYEQIINLTNPTVKKEMLANFADNCDKMAVELKAAALPRQRYQVILPLTTLKEGECFAPNYQNGEKLALIRYPHSGPHEIPIVTVNNKNKEGLTKITENAKDAIGIRSDTASILSGADFDGDTVVCIPISNGTKIRSEKPLQGLVGFDPHVEYAGYKDMKVLPKAQVGRQMGEITNLITDMSFQDPTPDELARAVRHSMVIIDANKHKLDYKRSYEENGIQALKEKYQKTINPNTGEVHIGGASTLLSLASSEAHITRRVGSAHINEPGKPWYDPNRPLGAKVYKQEQQFYTKVDKKTGKAKVVERTDSVKKMSLHDDARELMSAFETPVEQAYASFANELKAMANKARIDITKTGNIKKNNSAANTYKEEVAHLMAQLNAVKLNAPRERMAQRLANDIIEQKKNADPDIDKAMLKKIRQQAITDARLRVGAKGIKIDISDREWDAIQAGAISENTLSQILKKADPDRVRQLATPRKTLALNNSQLNLIAAMSSSGYTNTEIAERLNVSESTIIKNLPNKKVSNVRAINSVSDIMAASAFGQKGDNNGRF